MFSSNTVHIKLQRTLVILSKITSFIRTTNKQLISQPGSDISYYFLVFVKPPKSISWFASAEWWKSSCSCTSRLVQIRLELLALQASCLKYCMWGPDSAPSWTFVLILICLNCLSWWIKQNPQLNKCYGWSLLPHWLLSSIVRLPQMSLVLGVSVFSPLNPSWSIHSI